MQGECRRRSNILSSRCRLGAGRVARVGKAEYDNDDNGIGDNVSDPVSNPYHIQFPSLYIEILEQKLSIGLEMLSEKIE